MKKSYKITVYAITKNEEKFVDRWYKSMSEADNIVVLDTGSTDKTVEKLKQRGVKVEVQKITPWRFDTARNESLKLVPKDTDICVCTDLDEVFEEGWANTLRRHWKEDTEKVKYLYTWNHDKDNKPLTQIWYEKIHKNDKNWYWAMPVHEALTYKKETPPNTIVIPGDELHLHHYPDDSKSRGQYLDLMKRGIEENPNCFMQNWYYGRELYYHKKYDQSIKQLEKVDKMPYKDFEYQKSASLVFLGHCYKIKNKITRAESCYLKASHFAPDVREPLLHLTHLYYEQLRWYACIDAGLEALKVEKVDGAWYEDSRNYKEKPHDYLSIAYYNIQDFKEAYKHIKKAIEYNPTEKRFQDNLKLIMNKI